ncbi:DUF1707 SHOCT-like domain-containing protein [Phytoactinopolyspora endophytica]|uniref:DUF1707 SHOCT-like domain-containing protein n=1 Tax=Phytoactinopolyspora endophytica TaxID=1642495 RepID=UPI00101C29F9|nr:DUF1707 domain-containing protein [Phytoactinopolyspora endophytica]
MADPYESSSSPATRAADADRDAVAEILRTAVADGQLDLTELDDRLAATYAAKTRAELATVTADLGRAPQSDARPLRLRTKSGTLKKDGYWVVPAQIMAECSSGTIRFDFTEAECVHREVAVHVDVTSGSVVLTVPYGWSVNMDDVSCTSGNVSNKVTERPSPDAPLLRVSGQVTSGSVVARYPRRDARYPRRSFWARLSALFGHRGHQQLGR